MQNHKLLSFLVFSFTVFLFLFAGPSMSFAINEPTKCSGEVVDLGFPKKLLSFDQLSRPGNCGVTPTKIILHTTWGHEDAEGLFNYFETKPEGRYASTQFVVGKDGEVLQMLETLKGKVEIGWAVSYFNDDSISIEIGHSGNYSSKADLPPVQYESVMKVVAALMQAYNIDVGNIEADAINNSNNPENGGPISKNSIGVFGHYQLSPDDRTDPGEGFLKDIRADLKAGGFPSSDTAGGGTAADSDCFVTKVGNPSGPEPECVPENVGGGSLSGGPCQTAPTPPDRSLIRQAIIDKWGITLNLTEEQLVLAWEEFHEIDCTGFLQDLEGTLVGSWSNGYAQQFSCPGSGGAQGDVDIMFSNQWSGTFMKAILVHELTHVWQFCSSRGEANLLEVGQAYQGEGGLTKYSRNECSLGVGADRRHHEDQADTIALYLNPEQGELTCGNGAPNPFAGSGYPLHRTAAEKGVGKK